MPWHLWPACGRHCLRRRASRWGSRAGGGAVAVAVTVAWAGPTRGACGAPAALTGCRAAAIDGTAAMRHRYRAHHGTSLPGCVSSHPAGCLRLRLRLRLRLHLPRRCRHCHCRTCSCLPLPSLVGSRAAHCPRRPRKRRWAALHGHPRPTHPVPDRRLRHHHHRHCRPCRGEEKAQCHHHHVPRGVARRRPGCPHGPRRLGHATWRPGAREAGRRVRINNAWCGGALSGHGHARWARTARSRHRTVRHAARTPVHTAPSAEYRAPPPPQTTHPHTTHSTTHHGASSCLPPLHALPSRVRQNSTVISFSDSPRAHARFNHRCKLERSGVP